MMVQNEQGSWYENNQPPIGDCSLMHTGHMKALITELADALERIPVVLTPPDRDLIQRAREATK